MDERRPKETICKTSHNNNVVEKRPKGQNSRFNLGYVVLSLVIIYAINAYLSATGHIHLKPIPYSEFLHKVDSGEIISVTFSDDRIAGDLKNLGKPGEAGSHVVTIPAQDSSLTQRLLAKNIPFSVEPRDPLFGFLLSWILPIIFFYLIWSFIGKRMMGGASAGLLSMTKSKAKVYMEKGVKTTFADVAGIEEAKAELSEIVNYLQDPQRYTRLGGRAPKGVLLVGPPGTGKTLLARAVAGEAKVTFFSINGSEFVEMFVGLGAARVRDLFEQSHKQAPCILFIDEIDALGKSRSLGLAGGIGANDEKEQTLNQLLAEMDGFDSSEGVIMLAATNRPEVLDPALLRAGRFDRQVFVAPPDQEGRTQILAVHAKKIKLDPKLDLARIATLTSGFSGADLANLVNEAALVATRRGADAVTDADFSNAIERIIAGLEKKSKVMNADEKRRVAYHELGHTTVAFALDVTEKVHKVSIIPRGMGALGYTLQRPLEDRYLLDKEELMSKIAVLLGGRAAETIFFKEISTGAADDLTKATNIARAMVTQYGMGDSLGLETFDTRQAPYLQPNLEVATAARHPFSEGTAREIDVEIRSILDKAFRAALATLKRNRIFLVETAKKLLEKETLTEGELLALWDKFSHKLSDSMMMGML